MKKKKFRRPAKGFFRDKKRKGKDGKSLVRPITNKNFVPRKVFVKVKGNPDCPEALMDADPRVRARLRLDLEEAKRQYQQYGEWYESVFEPMVPIAQIDLPAPWKELRYQDNKKKIGETGKMPPAFLGFKDATQRYTISDGIHRINAAKDLGYKNVPAVVSYKRTYSP